MKKLWLLYLLPLALHAQNTIGFPEVINYSKHAYRGGLQNWDIRQDKNGIIYIANNEGLLSFDGLYWNLYPLPNRTIVRSVEIGNDGCIYVGGQDELGYFSPGKNGALVFHSLSGLIPEKERNFGDVWDIVMVNKDVFFRSSSRIFKFSNEKVATYLPPSEWAFMGVCNGVLYAQDFRTGILKFENQVWQPLSIRSELVAGDPVTAIVRLDNDSTIITSLKNGMFLFGKEGITRLPSLQNHLFETERIYAAIPVDANHLALATNNSGIYITDIAGNIIQHFSKTEQLQNNNVLSIFQDNQHNLWLGLDNGIDFIAYNSAIKHINPLLRDGSGYTAIIYNNRFYAGTSNGLYSVGLQQVPDLSFSKGDFTLVPGTNGQTWNLSEINGQLLLGHHEGAFEVTENGVTPIAAQRGYWNFVPLSATFPTSQMAAGNYRGLMFFNYNNGKFTPAGEVAGFTESSRFLAIDDDENFWISHPYHGIYKIEKRADGSYQTYLYTGKQGLPSALNNHVYKIKNEVVVATERGIYEYKKSLNRFQPSPFYQQLLGNIGIRYVKEDKAGNIWFIHDKTMGVIDFSGKEPTVTYLPELNNKMLSGFEYIFAADTTNIFLGGENGFYHINYPKYKKTVPALQVQVRSVRIINSNNRDSVLFGGYFGNVNDKQVQAKNEIRDIAYSWKTLRFEFSSSLFGYQTNLEYSYMLKGFEENWSDWNRRTEKEYTNLPAGSYVFLVKVRNNLGNESPVATYSFVVLPPWYQTAWSKILYLLIFAGSIYILYDWQRRKFIRQQQKHQEEQNQLSYIHELEISKTESELMTVKNEKLEAEINFKNSELASSAMHLVKKGELLTHIKTELAQVIKRIDNDPAIGEIKKMIRELNEDENIDKEWENFAKHFDKVHSDFVVKLKEEHPNLSNNDMKLCAYLRMNLSSKEIAQLLNISVRGVEISRYRLRKKMELTSEVNLFDYLIRF